MSTRVIPFQDGMKLGFGYDLVKGSPLTSPAVEGSVSSIKEAGGQRVQSHLVRITDIDTLHQSLGVNVDAGGSYFGVSADAKVDFAKECNVSRVSTHVMTGVTVRDAFENFDAPVLSQDANELLKNNIPPNKRFHERFGDVFIDGLLKGGEYFAIFEINSVDESVREKIAVHVEASFNSVTAAAHLDTDITNESQTTSSHVEVRVHVMQNGAIDHSDQTLEEMLKKAHDFPPSVAGDLAVPFAVSLADYRTLKLPDDQFNFLDIQNQRDVLAEHARKRFEFLQLLNTISYIRQHPDDFEAPDLDKLAQQFAKATAAVNTMEREASACLQNAAACTFTPFDVADFPLPKSKAFSPPPPPMVRIPEKWEFFRNVNVNPSCKEVGLRVHLFKHFHPKDVESAVGLALIISMDPPVGTLVEKGSTVTIHVGGLLSPVGTQPSVLESFIE